MVVFSNLLNKSIKKNKKLRQFSIEYRIQFGKNLAFQKKVRWRWVVRKFNSQIYLKLRKKPWYRTKRIALVIKFKKYCSLLYKYFFINLKKKKLYWLRLYLDSSVIKKLKKVRIKKKRLYAKTRRRMDRLRYSGQRKFLHKYFAIYAQNNVKKTRLRGKLRLLNSWVFNFHRLNLRLLSKTIIFNSNKYFIKFKQRWTKIFLKEKYFIYNWLSFYLFRIAYSKINKLASNYTSPYKQKLLIGIKEQDICSFFNLINSYLTILNFLLCFLYKIKLSKPIFYDRLITCHLKPKELVITKTFDIIFSSGNEQFLEIKPAFLRRFENLLKKKEKSEINEKSDLIENLLNFIIENKTRGGNILKNLFNRKSKFYVEKLLYNLMGKKDNKNLLINKFLLSSVIQGKDILYKKALNFLITDNLKKETLIIFQFNNIFKILLKKKVKKNFFCKLLYSWLFWTKDYNYTIFKKLFKPYNTWFFYLNYSINYYLFSKLYFVFFNYFFFIISQKFKEIQLILRLKKFELGYEFIKYKDNSRYYHGVRPRNLVTTFNRRLKKDLQ